MLKHLHDLIFRNRFHALGAHFYSEFQPQGLENPTLVCSSADVVQQLGLHADEVNTDSVSYTHLDVYKRQIKSKRMAKIDYYLGLVFSY